MAKKRTRKEKEYERHKKEILDAARKVFAEKSFEKATISEIAEEADFSVGTLYNHFESKKALFDELINSQIIEIQPRFEEIYEKFENPIEKLEQQLKMIAEYLPNKMDLLKLWVDTTGLPVSSDIESIPSGFRDFYKKSFLKTISTFAEAISQNLIIMIDPYYLAIAFHGIVMSFINAYVEDPDKHPLEQTMEDVKKIFFKSILTSKARLNTKKKKK